MGSIMSGRLGIALHSGGGPISRRLWYVVYPPYVVAAYTIHNTLACTYLYYPVSICSGAYN